MQNNDIKEHVVKIEKLDLFPSTIFTTDIPFLSEHVNDAVNYIEELSNFDSNKTVSNIGGWQSDARYDKFPSEVKEPALVPIVSEVFEVVKVAMQQYELPDPYIRSYWYNVNKEHHHNVYHTHPNNTMAAVVWLSVPEEGGEIEFIRNDNLNWAMPLKAGGLRMGTYWYKPAVGSVVVFPSSLPHYVKPFTGDATRISIAFNLGFDYENGSW